VTSGKVTNDAILALAITAVGATLAWFLSGGLPFIGIDDAAITRSYAENVALGNGYVYNVGGERVEGSTALLWVMILTVLYSITPTPEFAIISLCGAFAAFTVFAIFRLARLVSNKLELSPNTVVVAAAVVLLASPGYFMWSVWTMMELALWSMLLTCQVWLLAKALEPVEPQDYAARSISPALILVAALMPMVRPEGIAISVGLSCVALILSVRHWRVFMSAIVASLRV